jgi:hypothetical protein
MRFIKYTVNIFFYLQLADYPALPGYLNIPILYHTNNIHQAIFIYIKDYTYKQHKGIKYICWVKTPLYSTSRGNERCHEYGSDGYLAAAIIWFLQQCESSKFPASLRNIYKTYIRFLHIHIAMCVRSLVEIAPGVPELCPDIHTYTQTSIFIGIDLNRQSEFTFYKCAQMPCYAYEDIYIFFRLSDDWRIHRHRDSMMKA